MPLYGRETLKRIRDGQLTLGLGVHHLRGSAVPLLAKAAGYDWLFIDAEHGTSGTATLYLRSDGSRFLRLTGFETSNGPDLHVWISDQPSGGDCEGCFDSWGIYDDGEHVGLGALKGNIGAQAYEIPADAELVDFCKQSLASYKVPRRFERIAALPRNPTGKVRKEELRARLRG